jgi:hypothetical protein
MQSGAVVPIVPPHVVAQYLQDATTVRFEAEALRMRWQEVQTQLAALQLSLAPTGSALNGLMKLHDPSSQKATKTPRKPTTSTKASENDPIHHQNVWICHIFKALGTEPMHEQHAWVLEFWSKVCCVVALRHHPEWGKITYLPRDNNSCLAWFTSLPRLCCYCHVVHYRYVFRKLEKQ